MKKVHSTLNTPLKNALAGAGGSLLAYAFASRAIDTGSLFQYAMTVLLMVLSFKLIGRSFRLKFSKD